MIHPRPSPLAVAALLLATAWPLAATDIVVAPGASIQAAVDANPGGSSFLLKAGVHRLQQVTPKTGDVFTGETGTVLSGARLLTSFTREGAYWVAGGQNQQGQVHGEFEAGWPGAPYPEDLFYDDVPLQHVVALAEVRAGAWFFDYAADKIYVLDDPTGHRVETSVARRAFAGSATGVVIQRMTIEKYAIPAQMGAIGDQYPATDWTVQDCEIRLNHGTGLTMGSRCKALRNKLHHNGQKGIGGNGDDLLVEGNEIAFNNFAHYSRGWEAGGSKWALTQRLVVRNNWSHDNLGDGLWTDIDNIDTLYEGNTVVDNTDNGIAHEISYRATFRDNVVKGNGRAFSVWLWGSQILIQNSQDCEVYGNTVEVPADGGNGIGLIYQNRGTGKFGPYITRNNHVHDNTITHRRSPQGLSGAVADYDNATLFASGNWFDYNHYIVTDASRSHWAWNDSYQSWSGFRAAGQELHGTLQLAGTPNQAPVARIAATPSSGAAPLAVSFSGTGSSDADGSIAAYAWSFGDGASASGATVAHAYAAGSYTATLTVTDNAGATASATIAIAATTSAPQPPPPGTGTGIARQWWTGIGGTAVSDLTSKSVFPGSPSGADVRTAFEAPVDWADNYGTRMSGTITAPVAGGYVFLISGDDNCELWLASDGVPAHKARIAGVPGWTASREWGKYPEQRSAVVQLAAGQRCYLEALQKEATGGDSLAVGWQFPDGAVEAPIPGHRLTPLVPGIASTPYGGTARALPGTLQAEDFDEGGEGVAYHDLDATNAGGGYRATGVDVRACVDAGGGWQVGWFGAGEWQQYSVDVAAAGGFDAGVRVASGSSGATVHLSLDGVDVTGPLSFGNTGGWDTWATVAKRGIAVAAGRHVVRLTCDAGSLDCNWIAFTQPSGIVSGQWYKLVAKHSGGCLDVEGASTADAANVQQWSDNGSAAQQWRIDAVGDGSYTLTARCSGKVLDIAAGSLADGGNAIQWPLHGGPNQRWRIEDAGGGCYRLVSVNSGKVLDVSAGSTASGANAWQWTWLAGDNQRWSLVPLPPTGSG